MFKIYNLILRCPNRLFVSLLIREGWSVPFAAARSQLVSITPSKTLVFD